MTYDTAYKLFEQERARQQSLGWSREHDRDDHNVSDFLILFEKQLNDAKTAWYQGGADEALKPLVQLGALVTACIESQYETDANGNA